MLLTRSTHCSRNRIIMFLAITVFACLLSGCAYNAATGKRQFNIISESSEIDMGRTSDQEIQTSLGLVPDSSLQAYVSDLGHKLAATSERPSLPWTFRVVDDPAVNAFALPGGYIYVTRGILAHLNSEAELAGVMGHEIGHVTAKHSVTRMSTQQIAQIGLGVGMIAKPELQKYGEQISSGLGVLFLKFSRDDETEADHLGLRYMQRINDDPREMVGVMSMLDQVTKSSGGGRVPEWLATHPDPGNRKAYIQKAVDTIRGDLSKTQIRHTEYLDHVDGIVFGDNPRHGYFKQNVFYQPDLKFQVVFPTGWQTQNQPGAVVGVSAKQDAIMQISLSPKKTVNEAADAFFNRPVVEASGYQYGKVNGLVACWGDFNGSSDIGALKGSAFFISHDGNIYQILIYATQASWSENNSQLTKAANSFAPLTDAKILAVQPWRVKVITLKEQTTLEQFYQKNPSPAPLETLALINRVDKSATLKSGTKLKQIVGDKLP